MRDKEPAKGIFHPKRFSTTDSMGLNQGLASSVISVFYQFRVKTPRPFTPGKLRVIVGQAGEGKACFLKYIC